MKVRLLVEEAPEEHDLEEAGHQHDQHLDPGPVGHTLEIVLGDRAVPRFVGSQLFLVVAGHTDLLPDDTQSRLDVVDLKR